MVINCHSPSPFSQSLAITQQLSVSMDLPILDTKTSCERDFFFPWFAGIIGAALSLFYFLKIKTKHLEDKKMENIADLCQILFRMSFRET